MSESPAGKVLYVDYSTCIGCETCETVCGFLHDAPRIHMTRTRDGVLVPLYCRHCEKAHCIRACHRGALARDRDGAVVLQPMLCRGCETRECTQSCPYAAMVLTNKGVAVRKCDMCSERRAIGLGPACAAMCPTGAIRFLDRCELACAETEAAKDAEKRVLAHLRPSANK
ncbi:MAG: (Fe-S)-binding protein [Desulfovibrio sp.]|nr:(Fe-S)-binding protein [Desulfovibrio sp.]MCA1985111.1 (Fe-S)-binding protein [Desulfovibrio sp.]